MGRVQFMVPSCEQCGERPAFCLGRYDSPRDAYACDECCGHGNEDGHCRPLNKSDYQRLETANG